MGAGNREENREIVVPIKRGQNDAALFRSQGGGHFPIAIPNLQSRNIPGDLIIKFKVKETEDFKIQGKDVFHQVELGFDKLVFGTKIQIPTLESGKVWLSIPKGTKSGKKFRYKGKGLPFLEIKTNPYGMEMYEEEVGDFYVVVQVYIPESLDEKQEEMIEEMAKSGIFENKEKQEL